MSYQRIVSLAPSITESIFALNAGHLLVGVTDYCNFPPETSKLKSIGGFITPDLNKIKALAPQLLIATTTHKKNELEKVENFGIKVEVIKMEDIFDTPEAIEELGHLTNQPQFANKLASETDLELKKLLELAKKAKSVKKVYYLCSTGSFCAWKNKCTTTKLIELAGGKHIKLKNKDHLNSVITENPEVIIIPYSKDREEYKETIAFLEKENKLHDTIAYRTSNIQSITGELLLRPGPRSPIGFEQLINAIHPELF
ncbi:MAG: ABC transporter substrate-binding protein [Chloroflexia bacterium]|nr:ABC transporter substrate-binding protein [Chloroflexia bacterium]